MNKEINPDIFAKVRFCSTEEGGRKSPISRPKHGCLFVYKSENFSCFLLSQKNIQVLPGDEKVLPIKFLYPELIKSDLIVGDNFTLRELDTIGYGEVTEIL